MLKSLRSKSSLQAVNCALVILLLAVACAAPTVVPTSSPTLTTAPAAATPAPLPSSTPAPTVTATPAVSTPLAPEGEPGKTYYAPFPLTIKLDGDLGEWQGVPMVTIPLGSKPADQPSLTFAAAADDKFLYL
ncbi:MAG TPA: hypothetical protein VII92_20545, partial [Anaerolineae bacterium]